MKKGSLLFILFIVSTLSFANKYKLDDNQINKLFIDATNITIESSEIIHYSSINHLNIQKASYDDSEREIIAGAVALGGLLFTGGIVGCLVPVHRYILGVGGNEALIQLGYCFTWGGCGILTLVDGIMLIIDGTDGGFQYIENRKFVMWLD